MYSTPSAFIKVIMQKSTLSGYEYVTFNDRTLQQIRRTHIALEDSEKMHKELQDILCRLDRTNNIIKETQQQSLSTTH